MLKLARLESVEWSTTWQLAFSNQSKAMRIKGRTHLRIKMTENGKNLIPAIIIGDGESASVNDSAHDRFDPEFGDGEGKRVEHARTRAVFHSSSSTAQRFSNLPLSHLPRRLYLASERLACVENRFELVELNSLAI